MVVFENCVRLVRKEPAMSSEDSESALASWIGTLCRFHTSSESIQPEIHIQINSLTVSLWYAQHPGRAYSRSQCTVPWLAMNVLYRSRVQQAHRQQGLLYHTQRSHFKMKSLDQTNEGRKKAAISPRSKAVVMRSKSSHIAPHSGRNKKRAAPSVHARSSCSRTSNTALLSLTEVTQ